MSYGRYNVVPKTTTLPDGTTYPRVGTTHGMRGYFAVLYWWNPEGFPEPYDSGENSYGLLAGAEKEAKAWAEELNIPYDVPSERSSEPPR